MAVLHPVESELAAAWPPEAWKDVTVLLAVSGGPDSVALVRAMTTLKGDGRGRLLAAHVNHQLRGDDSEADEAFVVELCRGLGLPCEVHRAQVEQLAADSSDGLEAAARSVRYELLGQAGCRVGARYVVTAHTADDQAETILHRILRGTGIAGLSGIARARPLGPATLIRPLLGLRRVQLLGYLDDLGQAYRVDASNVDTRFTRNRIRHDLLPELAARFNPGVVDALLRLGSLAGEVRAVIDGLVEGLRGPCVVEQGSDGIRIRVPPLVDQPRYVVRELLMAVWRDRGWPLQAMGFAQWDLLADMVLACREDGTRPERSTSVPRKQTFPGAILAEIGEGHLGLRRVDS
ncbi:MAG TPA: tRNA lysidine(34) synthetase TilS [Thermoguttaceae bacterium]|nr:tRNA lysidine(34) synthetase TilS [Thermoguttaceae bacterium]